MAPVVPIRGALVTQLRIDYAVTLSFDSAVDLRLESAFTITTPGGALRPVQPSVDLEHMGFLLTLHQAVVAAAETNDQGRLCITFTDGRVLRCEPDEDYEAWNLSGPDGLLYVCLPGGGLAIWSASADR